MLKIKLSGYFILRGTLKFILSLLGIWPSESPSLFYRLLSCIQLPIQFGMFLAIFNFVRLYAKNISLFVKCFGIMSAYLSTTLRVLCFLINRKEALELHRTLDPHFTKLTKDKQMKKAVFQNFTTVKIIFWLFLIGVFVTLLPMIVTPVLHLTIQHFKPGKTPKYPMIYPSKYPWQTSSGWPYGLSFFFECLATLCLGSMTTSVDLFFLFYIFLIAAQFREMSHCIIHTEGLDEKTKDSVVRKTVYQYQTLIRAKEIIEKIYGSVILWVICTNAVIMCVFIFQFLQMKNLPIWKLMTIFTYVLSKMTQTYIYTWGGTFLTAESEEYRKAVYDIDWCENKKLMTSAIIMMAQKPMTITANHFTTVSVDMFTMVLKTTISYYCLLQTLEEK